MRKVFLKYYETRYGIVEDSQTINFDLQNLWSSFDYTNNWIMVDIEDDGWVTIRCMWDMKTKKWKDFISLDDKKKYDAAYSQYNRKRWDDMPILQITKKNYEQVFKSVGKIEKKQSSLWNYFNR